MRKSFFAFVLFILFISCTQRKDKEQIEDLQTPVKFRNNQNYGLFHPTSKQVIVKPNYTYIEDFSNGYCLGIRGKEGGICDVINTVGKVVFSYETAPLSHTYCFNGFFSFVYDKNDKYYHGLYDCKGNEVFVCNFIYGMNDECIVTQKANKYIFLFYDKQGIKNNKITLQDKYYCQPFKNGYSTFFLIENNEEKFGVIRNDKKIVIAPKYKNLGKEFVNDFIIAETADSLYGLLTKDGSWRIAPKYKKIYNYSGKVLSVKTDNWKLIDLNETVIHQLDKNIIIKSDFFNDIAIFEKTTQQNIKYGLINSEGKIILDALFDNIDPSPDSYYWRIKLNDKWMLFKEDEGILDPEKYLDFGKVK